MAVGAAADTADEAAEDMVAADMEVAAAAAVVTTGVAAATVVLAAAMAATMDTEKQPLIPDNLHWYIQTSPSVCISRRHKNH